MVISLHRTGAGNYTGIFSPANSEKVVVYRDNCRLFNLIVSHPETDDELLHEAKEVARILDV